MSNYIAFKESIEEKSKPDFYFRAQSISTLTVTNGALVLGLTTSGTALLAINKSMHDAMLAFMRGDSTQNEVADRFEQEFRIAHRQNVRDIEKQANIDNNPFLGEKFGVLTKSSNEIKEIPDIYAENTQTSGQLWLRVKASRPAPRKYLVECTQLDEEGNIVSVVEKEMFYASGTIDGLVSGANYRLRAKPIFATSEGVFTGYIVIRVN